MLALALLVALISAALVLEPLLRVASGRAIAAPAPLFSDSDDEDDPRLIRRDRALAALKEIEFDRATGKLSDDDYERMKSRFTAEALEALRAADAAESSARPPVRPSASSDAAVEQLIASARRRGASRRFCLECGAPLEGKGKFCLECGTAVTSPA
ncbi:MAG: hypothetical protein ACHQX4_08405 [Gemmatimonadales bacterium]